MEFQDLSTFAQEVIRLLWSENGEPRATQVIIGSDYTVNGKNYLMTEKVWEEFQAYHPVATDEFKLWRAGKIVNLTGR